LDGLTNRNSRDEAKQFPVLTGRICGICLQDL
jgi:hypothetical protein